MRFFLGLYLASLYLAPIVLLGFDGPYTVTTVAGSGWVGDNGPATGAILLQAEGIATDPGGNIYISDATNHRVRKLSPSGTITTVAGTGSAGFSGDGGPATAAQLNSPYGLAYDSHGNLYIADLGNARVRCIQPDGTIATVAGGGSIPVGEWNNGSTATVVVLAGPRNLALDSGGNLYISDFSAHRVYRLAPDGSLWGIAGTGVPGYSGDGLAAAGAQLFYPTAVAVDRYGALYIADSQNHLIRKVAGGIIYSIGRAATPTGLALDSLGTLYVADEAAGLILRFPVAGSATALNLSARDLAFNTDGYLYDADDTVVRRVSSSSGVSSIVAGGGNPAYGDRGAATAALLNHPSGAAVDSLGNLYIADRDNNRIRRVTTDGLIATFAGTGVAGNTGDGGQAVQAQLNAPSSVSLDAAGNLYIADTGNHRVREVTPWGQMGPVVSTGLDSPVAAAPDGNGNVYVADAGAGAILKVSAGGSMTTVLVGLASPGGLALDAAGNLYFTEAAGPHVRRLGVGGDVTGFAEGTWSAPRGIAVDAAGGVWVADAGLQRVFHIDSTGNAAVVAGNGSAGFEGDGGAALAAEFSFPWSVAVGPPGTLYISDLGDGRIRQLAAVPSASANSILVVSVVNAASLQPGPVAPGMLLSLSGTGLTAADVPATEILFNAIPASIVSVTATQLLVEAPVGIAGLSTVQIAVSKNGVSLAQIAAAVTDAAPALFANASGQAAATNEDGSVNSASNPAARGSVVTLYGTGQGSANLPVSVSIAGLAAQVLYAGPIAAYQGMMQINARVPAGYITPGNLSVVVTVGAASSPPGVTIAVD